MVDRRRIRPRLPFLLTLPTFSPIASDRAVIEILPCFCRSTALLPLMLAAAFPVLAPAEEPRPATVHDLAGLDLGVRPSDIEPAVTLREHENRVVEEYRVNNQLYMMKITPRVGAPYYLVDQDGSGDMAWHRGARRFEKQAPQWVLLSW